MIPRRPFLSLKGCKSQQSLLKVVHKILWQIQPQDDHNSGVRLPQNRHAMFHRPHARHCPGHTTGPVLKKISQLAAEPLPTVTVAKLMNQNKTTKMDWTYKLHFGSQSLHHWAPPKHWQYHSKHFHQHSHLSRKIIDSLLIKLCSLSHKLLE